MKRCSKEIDAPILREALLLILVSPMVLCCVLTEVGEAVGWLGLYTAIPGYGLCERKFELVGWLEAECRRETSYDVWKVEFEFGCEGSLSGE